MSQLHLIWSDPTGIMPFVTDLLSFNPGVINIDGDLYYTDDINSMQLELPLPPNNQLDEAIQGTIQALVPSVKITARRMDDTLIITGRPRAIKNLDTNILGIFLYMLYLRDLFQGDSNVCVMISPIGPLLQRARNIIQDVNTADLATFAQKHPMYQELYDPTATSLPSYRMALLSTILTLSGPFIHVNTLSDQITTTRAFRTLFDRCRRSGARYIVSFIVVGQGDVGHANMLIFDNEDRVMERFDPNGADSTESLLGSANLELDSLLDSFAQANGYFYAPPSAFCPQVGIQAIEHGFKGRTGYCVSWSIVYGEERLRSTQSRSVVSSSILPEIVRRYHLRGSNDQETAHNVERWLNRRIDEIFTRMEPIYEELADYLERPVEYQQGQLKY